MVDFKSLVPWRSDKPPVPATREDFFDPFVTLRREIDRMFDDFFGGGSSRRAGFLRATTSPLVRSGYCEAISPASLLAV
jgi:hypothetical protein